MATDKTATERGRRRDDAMRRDGRIRLSGWITREASEALTELEAREATLSRQDIVSTAIVEMASRSKGATP